VADVPDHRQPARVLTRARVPRSGPHCTGLPAVSAPVMMEHQINQLLKMLPETTLRSSWVRPDEVSCCTNLSGERTVGEIVPARARPDVARSYQRKVSDRGTSLILWTSS
jgi:hypothetical protein